MGAPYIGLVTMIGTTDVQSVITDLKQFVEENDGGLWDLKATAPWAFEDTMAVRFHYATKNQTGIEVIQAFSKNRKSLRFDVLWSMEECFPNHGEALIDDGEIIAVQNCSGRPEIQMSDFVEPSPKFFVSDVGLTLPQLFQYRMKQIASQLKEASSILDSLEPDFYGVPPDPCWTKIAQQKVKALAEHAETVASRLYLGDVLFPHPSESAELQAKIDALMPTEAGAAPEAGGDDDIEIPF